MNLSGSPFDYLVAFLGGILVSFTPCVYPLIPVSVGYIGIRANNSKLRAFILSLIYVTGIAVTYSILGLLASLTGKIFGTIATHPLTYLIAGVVIIVFGFSLLNMVTISLPNFIKFPKPKQENYFSTFLLGLSSGLMISPCLTPVLGSILVYLATKKSLLYGMTLLLSFAYGMGIILILSGTLSAVLMNLPKSGKWMLYIKKLCAFILIVMGSYFIFQGLRRI